MIKNDVLDRIFQHAIDEYPNECCGIVTGKGDSERVYLCKNIQNELHKKDPVTFTRDARTAYAIDRAEAERIFKEAKEKGEAVTAFYHSHVEHEAYFSETDVAAQIALGEPEFPDAIHIVVSVKQKKINDLKCFKWDKEKKDFVTLISFDRKI